MIYHLLRDMGVLSEIEARAALLSEHQAGKLSVEFNLKDGRWTLGNVGVLFPRRHHDAGELRQAG